MSLKNQNNRDSTTMQTQTHNLTTTAGYNRALDSFLHRIKYMNLKRWKIIKSVLLSLAVLGFATYAIMQGADPTTIGLPAVIMAGLIAGVELSEYVAAFAEVHQDDE